MAHPPHSQTASPGLYLSMARQETASDGQVALAAYSASCFTDHQSRSARAGGAHAATAVFGCSGRHGRWPLASYAQGPGLPVVGYLGPEAPERFASRVNAFRDGLAET